MLDFVIGTLDFLNLLDYVGAGAAHGYRLGCVRKFAMGVNVALAFAVVIAAVFAGFPLALVFLTAACLMVLYHFLLVLTGQLAYLVPKPDTAPRMPGIIVGGVLVLHWLVILMGATIAYAARAQPDRAWTILAFSVLFFILLAIAAQLGQLSLALLYMQMTREAEAVSGESGAGE